jgi:hypothetical protein
MDGQKPGGAKVIYRARKLAAMGKTEGDGSRAGQGRVYHFHLEIKCDFFSSSLNNLFRHRQFKKKCPSFMSCAVVQGIVSTWEIVFISFQG